MSSSLLDELEDDFVLDSDKYCSILFDNDIFISLDLRKIKMLNITYTTKITSEKVFKINQIHPIY